MRTYIPQLPQLDAGSPALRHLLERGDACSARVRPFADALRDDATDGSRMWRGPPPGDDDGGGGSGEAPPAEQQAASGGGEVGEEEASGGSKQPRLG